MAETHSDILSETFRFRDKTFPIFKELTDKSSFGIRQKDGKYRLSVADIPRLLAEIESHKN